MLTLSAVAFVIAVFNSSFAAFNLSALALSASSNFLFKTSVDTLFFMPSTNALAVSLSSLLAMTSFNALISSCVANVAFAVSKVAVSNLLASSPFTRFFSAVKVSLLTFLANSVLIAVISDLLARPSMTTSSPLASAPAPFTFFKVTLPSVFTANVPFFTCNSSALLTLSVVRLVISAAFAFLFNSSVSFAVLTLSAKAVFISVVLTFLPSSVST